MHKPQGSSVTKTQGFRQSINLVKSPIALSLLGSGLSFAGTALIYQGTERTHLIVPVCNSAGDSVNCRKPNNGKKYAERDLLKQSGTPHDVNLQPNHHMGGGIGYETAM